MFETLVFLHTIVSLAISSSFVPLNIRLDGICETSVCTKLHAFD